MAICQYVVNRSNAPLWDGEPLHGQPLLLFPDLKIKEKLLHVPGHGDMIFFARYIQALALRSEHVILACPPALMRLFSTLKGVNEVVSSSCDPQNEAWPRCGAAALYGDLIGLLGINRLNQEWNRCPYLSVPAGTTLRLDTMPGLRVGLVWAASHLSPDGAARSCPLEAFQPLLQIHGVNWYSLQVGQAAGDIQRLGLDNALIDLSPRLTDFAETAAAIAQLDLVITVDTAVAHLAGAMEKPAWVCLPFPITPTAWRYWHWSYAMPMVGGQKEYPTVGAWLAEFNRRAHETTHMYPTARLFRMKQLGDWSGVVERVLVAMSDLIRKF